jgi:CheY-like chemotaxis protein
MVLVVDDDEEFQIVMAQTLPGHVRCATFLEDGIALAKEHQPMVILLDNIFVNADPPRTGAEAILEINEKSPKSRIVLYTAHFTYKLRNTMMARFSRKQLLTVAPNEPTILETLVMAIRMEARLPLRPPPHSAPSSHPAPSKTSRGGS